MQTVLRKKAIITPDHRVHFDMDMPENIPVGEAEFVLVAVTPTSAETQKKYDGEKAVEILKRIAARGTLAKAIPDPVAWQREIRQDRPLPGRD